MTADGNPCRPLCRNERNVTLTHSCRKSKSGTEGFTILEVLVAMALMVFGVLGFTGLLKVIGSVEAEDTWETKALFCAQERLEELKFACSTGKGLTTGEEEIAAGGSYQGMRREWTVGGSSVFEGLLELKVGCAYPSRGATKTVELSTLVYREE